MPAASITLSSIVTFHLLANARHVSKSAEHATFTLIGHHFSPTRGAVVANLSRAVGNITFSRAATLATSQIRFCDDGHV